MHEHSYCPYILTLKGSLLARNLGEKEIPEEMKLFYLNTANVVNDAGIFIPLMN